VNRKQFILSILLSSIFPKTLKPIGKSSFLEIGILKYSGNYNFRNSGLKKMLWEVSKRTSIEVSFDIIDIDLKNKKKLFKHPLLFLTGDNKFYLSRKEIKNLKNYLSFGGLLFIDSADDELNGFFNKSVENLIEKLYPRKKLKIAPKDHVIYRTFNLLDKPYGRLNISSSFYIIEEDNRVEVLYSKNDIIGALTVDNFSNWKYPVLEGSKTREMAYRTGVNIIMYATCLAYKADQVHIDYLLKNRR
jgi:hypothetical protein